MFSVIKNTLYRACKKLFNVQNQIDWANERHYKKNIETDSESQNQNKTSTYNQIRISTSSLIYH